MLVTCVGVWCVCVELVVQIKARERGEAAFDSCHFIFVVICLLFEEFFCFLLFFWFFIFVIKKEKKEILRCVPSLASAGFVVCCLLSVSLGAFKTTSSPLLNSTKRTIFLICITTSTKINRLPPPTSSFYCLLSFDAVGKPRVVPCRAIFSFSTSIHRPNEKHSSLLVSRRLVPPTYVAGVQQSE